MTKFNNTSRLEAATGYTDCLVNKKTKIWLQPNNLSSEGGFMDMTACNQLIQTDKTAI
jgi:hypothetical protein